MRMREYVSNRSRQTYRRKLVLVLSIAKGSIPLYMQIKGLLVARVTEGKWAPGDIIPSEMQLAQELKVSQGTVRKAITELVENNVLVRRQGKGTFVASHDYDRALFHFFHIVNDSGNKILPRTGVLNEFPSQPAMASSSDAATPRDAIVGSIPHRLAA